MNSRVVLVLNKKEKEELVLKLLNEGKTTREIAKLVHVSLKNIGIITRKAAGDDKSDESEAELVQNRKLTDKSYYAQSFQMFKEGKSLVDVVIELDLDTDQVQAFYSDYLDLINRTYLINIHSELKNDFPLFLHLFRRIKKEGLNKQDITDLLESQNELKEMEKRVTAANSLLASLNSDILQLEKEIIEKQNLLYDR
jgi:Trp operon repressor